MIKKYKFFNEDSSLYDKFYSLSIKEGLIHSVDYDFFIEKLNNLLNQYDVEFNIQQKDEYVELYVNLKNIIHKDFDKKIQELLNNCGYFTSNLIDTQIDNKIKSILISKNDEFIYFFQKRFDVPKDTPKILLHSTTKYYYEKIKRTGLSPKSQKMISDDLDRLYLTDNLAEALDFCTQKRFFYKGKYKDMKLFDMNIDSWVVLEIDIYSIPDIKLYEDPKMSNSYYTYDFIPFYAIKVKKEIDFSK
jgi:hypothetical protein